MSIPVLQDLQRNPINYSAEYKKFVELTLLDSQLTTSGNASWVSPSSGINYPATTGGQQQLLGLLSAIPEIQNSLLNADKWNSIQQEVSTVALQCKVDIEETRALYERYANANAFVNQTGYGAYTLFDSTSDGTVDIANTTASISTTSKNCTWDNTGTKILKFNNYTFNSAFNSMLIKIDGSYTVGVVQSSVTNSNNISVSTSYPLTINDKLFAYSVISNARKEIGITNLSGGAIIIDRTTPVQVVNSAYDTSGNGGRKLVRDSEGVLYSALRDSTPNYRIYKSIDNGATWNLFKSSTDGDTVSVSLSILPNNNIALFYARTAGQFRCQILRRTDATTLYDIAVDASQTAVGNVSLTIDSNGYLHASWVSKNATYPNSFNIRYSKSTDGGVTWATPTQVTTLNAINNDMSNPCISVMGNVNPIIIHEYRQGTNPYRIVCHRFTTSWVLVTIYDGGAYTQSLPSATVDSNGVIHVAWHGTDATDTGVNNIRYSKSTDNGTTWLAMVKLTSGNTQEQSQPSIASDESNNVHVAWQGLTATFPSQYNIRYVKITGGVVGSIEEITNQGVASKTSPSLCDNIKTFEKPLMIFKDSQNTRVAFYGKWSIGSPYVLTLSENVTQLANDNLPITTQYIVKQGTNTFAFDSVLANQSLQYRIDGLNTQTANISILGKSSVANVVAYVVA